MLVGTGLLLGTLVAVPQLFGGLLLNRYGEQLGLSAERVSGPLWAPKLSGAALKSGGVDVKAGEVRASVAGVDFADRTLRLNVVVKRADIALKLADLVGQGGATAGPGGGWKTVLSSVRVESSRVTVDGRGLNVPPLDLRVDSDETGALAVTGRTPDGELSARVQVGEQAGTNTYTVNFSADARVLRHYWKGVEAGRITGRYLFGAGPIRGDLNLTGGVLRVPEAGFVEVRGVSGSAQHRGDAISVGLAGRGWNGPVTARGGVDLAAQHWTVTADATPTIAGLAEALNTVGQGDLKLRVTAQGWSDVRVKGYAKANGQFAGVPFQNARAEYTFLNRAQASAPEANDLAFSATTKVAGVQALRGRWAFGRAGEASWKGDLAGRPLDLMGRIDARNLVRVIGSGFGGPLAGTYALGTGQIDAALSPDYGAARARVELSGTPNDLRARVSDGQAGPFALAGTARFGPAGLSADLGTGLGPDRGTVRLDLDRAFQGTWQARDLSASGFTVSGGGRVNFQSGDLGGTLRAELPGVDRALSGPVQANFLKQTGSFVAGDQRLGWQGEAFTLRARDLGVLGGTRVDGDVTLTTDLRATGVLTARGGGYDLRADLRGERARLRGTAGGVTVLADADVRAPFRTAAQIQGAGVAGVLSVTPAGAVNFTLDTLGARASGVIQGQNWDATGRVNLAALRPLLPEGVRTSFPDLSGTLDLGLAGLGGSAQLAAEVGVGADRARLAGTLTRQPGSAPGGALGADLRATVPLNGEEVLARLSGQVYPRVEVSGTAQALGQTLRAVVSGPYDALRATVQGRTGELSFGGVSVPAQAVNLRATLTPGLRAEGRWGELDVTYDGESGLVRVTGAQTLTAFGQTGQVRGRATWGPNFQGAVEARGTLDQYTLVARGPWQGLNVLVTDAEGLEARGTASLPSGRYDVRVRGPLQLPGQPGPLTVDGTVQGRGSEPRGVIAVRDGAGGRGTLRLNGFNDLDLQAAGLTLAGQKLSGTLQARGGVLSGRLRAGPLDVVAGGGRIQATGNFGGQRLTASGKLTLPATLSDLRVNVDGPYFSARATGGVADLRGSVTLKAQRLGADAARLVIPAQSYPLRASVTGARATVGGLIYQSGRWGGGLSAAYTLQTPGTRRAGLVRLAGSGETLAALPSGPLSGRVNLLPALGGTLSAPLSPFLTALPAEVRAELQAGDLVARIGAAGADLALRGSRYQGSPLRLAGRFDWAGGGFGARGVLSHRDLSLPLAYDGRNLAVTNARLAGRLLRPLLPGAAGELGLSLSLPGLDPARASGRLRVGLRAAGQTVGGDLRLVGGLLSGELNAGPLRLVADRGALGLRGTFAEHELRASGQLRGLTRLGALRVGVSGPYLTAAASGPLGDLRGTLNLREQRFGSGAAELRLPAQSFPLSASVTELSAEVGGLSYQGGRWKGGLNAAYALQTGRHNRRGTLRLAGGGTVLAALPSGPVTGRVGLLPDLGGTLRTSAAPLAAALPAEVRAELQAGDLVARVSAGGADVTLQGARYLAAPLGLSGALNWQGALRAQGLLTHRSTRIPVTFTGGDLRVTGARLGAESLTPLLPGEAAAGVRGQATLDLTVPDLDLTRAAGQARVDLRTQDQQGQGQGAQGQRAQGTVTLVGGQLGADLQSTLGAQALTVRGAVYPRADATVQFGDVRATVRGDARTRLTVQAAGEYEGQQIALSATGEELTRRVARAEVSGSVAGVNVAASLRRGAGEGLAAWKVGGTLAAPDLRALANTQGRVSATLGGSLADLVVGASGEVAGVTFTAPARYAGGVLRVQGASAQFAQGEARASGTLFPRLDLSARASLNDLLPGEYTAQVGGSLAKPDVRAQGRLTQGVQGVDAAGTALSARWLGPDWKLDLSGEKLAGTVRGQLGSGAVGGLQSARLSLQTAYRSGDTRVNVSGPLGWNVREGWSGGVRLTGDVPGGALDAVADGRGALALAGTLGQGETQASFTGTLPAALPLRPAGTLNLTRLDAGAFWGRAGQLRASGALTLGGAGWNTLQANFAGRLDDAAGELSGAVVARYAGGDLNASLTGPRVTGRAALVSGRYDLALKSQPLRLARLLPGELDVDALTFGGQVTARGTLAGGPEEVLLENVALRGEQGDVGPFTLFGSAQYRPARTGSAAPETLSAELRGSLRGGTVSASGALPDGLRVQVRGVQTAFQDAASFGTGAVNADLTFAGVVRDPVVSGRVTGRIRTEAGVFDPVLTLSGRAARPSVTARVEASGEASGTLYAEAREVDFSRLASAQVPARVYGTLRSGQTLAQIDLRGTWPRLSGAVRAEGLGLEKRGLPVALDLRADGQGGYALNAGALGGAQAQLTPGTAGLLPTLAGTLNLDLRSLLGEAGGEARVTGTLGGTLAAPTLAGALTTRGLKVGGASLNDTAGTLTGTLTDLSSLRGSFSQAGEVVATLSGTDLTVRGLKARAAGSALSVRGTAGLGPSGPGPSGRAGPVADLTVETTGELAGILAAKYDRGSLSVGGTVGAQGFSAAVNVRANPYSGWSGGARVTGGPPGVLTAPLALNVGGAYRFPLVTGTGELLGAGAKVVADARGVHLRLTDGSGATANGALELRPEQGEWRWRGAASLTRPELALSVTPTGPLADPDLFVTLRRGEWRASGTASLDAADLSVSDGQREGTLRWNGQEVSADLPGLDLGRLGVAGVNGTLTASGAVSRAQTGAVTFRVAGLRAPQRVPVLGLDLAGDVSGTLTLTGGVPSVQARADLGAAGRLDLSATQTGAAGARRWTGQVQGALKQGEGTLALDVRAQGGGLSGTADVRAYPLDLAGQTVKADGELRLLGQTFTASLKGVNGLGSVSASAEGGVSDTVPALEALLGIAPTGDGYDVRALLGDLDLAELGVAPGLSGQVYGEARLSEGGGTFLLGSDAVRLGQKTLPLRVEGSQVGGSWRLRGFLDRSEFTAGLTGGEVFGQGTLQALPLGAVLAAFAGTTPGEGVVTGVARFRFPLADPLAGSASVVAERIRVSAPREEVGEGGERRTVTETLTGSGSLDYAARELRRINVQLAGAGTWDVQGQYTRQKVDVNARFTDATFTPVLRLIPGLADLAPALRGTVVLSAAGTYDRPRGLLRAEGLRGSVAGLSVQVPSFAGDLPDSGAFTAGGRVLTGGAVGTDGRIEIAGQLTLGQLSGTRATFSGLLAPQALGPLPNTTLTLRQQGVGGAGGWALEGQSRSLNPETGAGTLTLAGNLTPRLDLKLSARNYNLPLSAVYARESALSGDFALRDDGDFIRVTGAGDFARLTLGRVDAPDTLPALPTTPGAAGGNGPAPFASPLPEAYTTFPKPQTAPGVAAPTPARPLLERVLISDVVLRASGGIRVDEALARAEFTTTGLTVSGTAARPRVRGEIGAVRGSISLRENEFTVTQANVTFSGQDVFPSFVLRARGEVPSAATGQRVPILLNVRGDYRTVDGLAGVLNLTTTLSCAASGPQCRNPGTGNDYGQAELYALVATGFPDLSSLPSNLQALGTSALQTALNIFFLSELERNVARALGVDVFRLTPAVTVENGVQQVNATFTVGSYLTRELFVQYQVDLRGQGLINAAYSTPDGRFTFKVSTPLSGLNLQSVRPSFDVAYNVSPRLSFSVGIDNQAAVAAAQGVEARPESTQVRFGVTYRIGAR
ncbi:Autotransporter translocation and assembly factor TamB [Deinococcus reticulitermitis]|uniref:Autotransporter translocation and assembly factor TamB n=1 Tax=Deinococcus reticulitermitis TaxID=856736 RepID=A0A1H6SV98_9DEIO|nr:Autotransporter translocation and assembly factor TamB [Deinococcus reticulitermitis]